MRQLINVIFFPVPYPAAIIWHLILGAFLYCLVAVPFGFRGDFGGAFAWWHPVFLQVAAMIGGGIIHALEAADNDD